jgi:hypothetical protein
MEEDEMGTTCKRPQGRSLRALTMTLVLALLAALLLAGTALAATPSKPTAKAPRGTITQAKPTFTWSKARGAAKYEVRIYKGGKLLLKKTGISKRSWKNSKALPKNVSLTWKVRAKNARGPGAWSKSARFKVVMPLSLAKAVTAFSFQGLSPAVAGTINGVAHTIALTVPFGTDVSAMVPTITITGVSVNPASGVANNFTSPRTFTVTAADGTTQAYVVTVTVAANPATKYLVTSSSYSPVAAATVTISAQLADAYNNPVGTPGTTVTWTKSNGNGSFAAATSTTNASGIATVVFTAHTVAGTVTTVTGATGALTGTSSSITTTAGAATKIAVNAGAGQSAVAGTVVATSPSVIVKDAYDNVVSGVSITFVVATGGGFGTGLAAMTDAGGIAAVGSWALGTTAGANTLTATSAGLTGSPLTFTATSTAGAATKYLVTSSSYSPVAGATVTISAQLADASGNAVSTAGNLVTWTKSNANGSFATATSTTNANGVATVAFTTNTTSGTANAVTGTSPGPLTGTSAVITTTLAIGDSYQGGKVAYFFVPGDAGYVAGQLHGLIVAASNQSDDAGMAWSNIDATLVGTHPELGTGQANTTAIVGQAGCTSGAAYTCHYLIVSGVYDDWYLPSQDELNKVYLNKDAIGGIEPGFYWTSSEVNAVGAYTQFLGSGGSTSPAYKYVMRDVRAVRSF